MSDNMKSKIPTWFWVVAALALIWNLMGVMAYIAQMTMSAEIIAALPDAERELYEQTPGWANGAFAFAVWFGALGSLFLLLKKKWSTPVLLISLVGVAVQMFHSFFLSKSFEVYGPGAVVMPMMIMVVAILLPLFSIKATKSGWIT